MTESIFLRCSVEEIVDQAAHNRRGKNVVHYNRGLAIVERIQFRSDWMGAIN